jgi:hypothetical protein
MTAPSALACLSTSSAPVLRDHHVLRVEDGTLVMNRLDLATVLLPGTGWELVPPTSAQRVIELLSDEESARVHRNRRAFITLYPKHAGELLKLADHQQLHFGALRPGSHALVFRSAQAGAETQRELNVTIKPREFSVSRGRVLKAGAEGASGQITIEYYDTLEVTLPGNPTAAWDVGSPAATFLELKEVRAAGEGLATLVLKPTQSNSTRVNLVVHHAGARWSFTVQHRFAATC